MPRTAFLGIDVAFAVGKRLPVCVVVRERDRFVPLPLAAPGLPQPPRGRGNAAALDDAVVRAFAREAVAYVREVERHFEVEVVRVGIDAPRAPAGRGERQAEQALRARGMHCIPTPTAAKLREVRARCRVHLDEGGPVARLPGANQLWMLPGFALFSAFERAGIPCREVYPQAAVFALDAHHVHKLRGGLPAQLAAVARATGWTPSGLARALTTATYGPTHDRLDAFLSAWIAALDERELDPIGAPPRDVIWAPLPQGRAP